VGLLAYLIGLRGECGRPRRLDFQAQIALGYELHLPERLRCRMIMMSIVVFYLRAKILARRSLSQISVRCMRFERVQTARGFGSVER